MSLVPRSHVKYYILQVGPSFVFYASHPQILQPELNNKSVLLNIENLEGPFCIFFNSFGGQFAIFDFFFLLVNL